MAAHSLLAWIVGTVRTSFMGTDSPNFMSSRLTKTLLNVCPLKVVAPTIFPFQIQDVQKEMALS